MNQQHPHSTPPSQRLRLRIAAMALQGILAKGPLNNSPEYVARHALAYADALIKESTSKTPQQ